MKLLSLTKLLLHRLLPAGIISAILFVAIFMACSKEHTPDVKIYAIKYGESLFPEKYMYRNSSTGKETQFTWLCYYVEYLNRRILIDTGFVNPSYIKMFNIRNYTRPSDILRNNGIDPESITDIIITHGHFDHADGISDYGSARIVISATALGAINKGNYGNSISKKFMGNTGIISFQDTYNFEKHLTIKEIGGHAEGSSVVYLEYGEHRYCFTGDEVYSAKSIIDKIPNGTVTNINNNIKFISEYNPDFIPLTFHNPDFYGRAEKFIRIYPD